MAGDIGTTFSLVASTPAFFGVIEDAGTFQTVTFNLPSEGETGYDAAAFGAGVIPEPATLSLLGLGLLAAARRRRRR